MALKRPSQLQRLQHKIKQILEERRALRASAAALCSRASALGDEYDQERWTGLPDTKKTSQLASQLMTLQLASHQAKALIASLDQRLEVMGPVKYTDQLADQAARQAYRVPVRPQLREIGQKRRELWNGASASKLGAPGQFEKTSLRVRKVHFAKYPKCRRLPTYNKLSGAANDRDQTEENSRTSDTVNQRWNVAKPALKRLRSNDDYGPSSSPTKRQKRAHHSIWPEAYTEVDLDEFTDFYEYQHTCTVC